MALTHNMFSVLDALGEFPPIHKGNKRQRKSIFDKEFEPQAGAKYIIMRHAEENKNLLNVSPFLINKGIEAISLHTQKIKRTKSGEMLILTKNKSSSDNFLKSVTLGGTIPIKCSLHPFLNSSQGTVYSRDLIDLPETEIVEGLASQNVTECKRVMRMEKGKLEKTPLLILTFNAMQLPSEIFAGFLLLKVKTYVPKPMRCTNCQIFGHTKKRCQKASVCPKCSALLVLPHTNCDKIQCVNCNENHESYSKKCKIYEREFDIQKIKTLERIPYGEARARYNQLLHASIANKNHTPLSAVMRNGSPSPSTSNEKPTETIQKTVLNKIKTTTNITHQQTVPPINKENTTYENQTNCNKNQNNNSKVNEASTSTKTQNNPLPKLTPIPKNTTYPQTDNMFNNEQTAYYTEMDYTVNNNNISKLPSNKLNINNIENNYSTNYNQQSTPLLYDPNKAIESIEIDDESISE